MIADRLAERVRSGALGDAAYTPRRPAEAGAGRLSVTVHHEDLWPRPDDSRRSR